MQKTGSSAGKVEVRTPNVPDYLHSVDKRKYELMRTGLLRVLPRKPPGLSQGEMVEAVASVVSRKDFPGKTVNWWAKCVQLDLEARGILERDVGTPLRWRRTSTSRS